jgi:hypothetical protein
VVAQVVEETYGWVLILVEHNFARFASFVRGILRGTKTGDLAKHVRDSHIDNWDRIRGALADVYLMAAVRVRWEYSLKYVNKVAAPPRPSLPASPLLQPTPTSDGGGWVFIV